MINYKYIVLKLLFGMVLHRKHSKLSSQIFLCCIPTHHILSKKGLNNYDEFQVNHPTTYFNQDDTSRQVIEASSVCQVPITKFTYAYPMPKVDLCSSSKLVALACRRCGLRVWLSIDQWGCGRYHMYHTVEE